MASGMPAFEMVFRSNSMRTSFSVSLSLVLLACLFCPSNLPHQHEYGIIKFVDHALLQRNDRIVRDVDILRTHFRAAFSNVAQTDAEFILEHACARLRIERMHFE